MPILKIEKREWKAYFDYMSRILDGKSAEIEVDALAIGAQLEVEWVPFLGIMYDPGDDIVSVMVEGLDHMIRHPESVLVDFTVGRLVGIEIVDADRMHHLIKLRDPLMLPAPP
jgi:hypothetical protein